ncbi:MAG: hypothetical protein U5R31_06910 [Acidimicrobiia bacterium]|nr:hypothetical protein [Acidimicrobiia bacterium]
MHASLEAPEARTVALEGDDLAVQQGGVDPERGSERVQLREPHGHVDAVRGPEPYIVPRHLRQSPHAVPT